MFRAFLEASDFYDKRHRVVFKAMLAVADEGGDVDPETTWAELDRTGQTVEAGGVGWAADLLCTVQTNTGMPNPLPIVQKFGAQGRVRTCFAR